MDSPGSPLTWMTAVVGIIKYDHPSSSKQPKVRCCSLRPQSCVISASQPWACCRAHDRVVSAVSNRSIFVLEIQKGVSFQFFPLASWDCPPTPPPPPRRQLEIKRNSCVFRAGATPLAGQRPHHPLSSCTTYHYFAVSGLKWLDFISFNYVEFEYY